MTGSIRPAREVVFDTLEVEDALASGWIGATGLGSRELGSGFSGNLVAATLAADLRLSSPESGVLPFLLHSGRGVRRSWAAVAAGLLATELENGVVEDELGAGHSVVGLIPTFGRDRMNEGEGNVAMIASGPTHIIPSTCKHGVRVSLRVEHEELLLPPSGELGPTSEEEVSPDVHAEDPR